MVISKSLSSNFIISTGRTGTKFLIYLLNELFEGLDARHEPPPIPYKLRFQFGTKRISINTAIKQFMKERYKLHQQINKEYYIESNPYLSLLIPVIKNVFSNYKIVYIVRDGRDWLRSAISRGIYDSYIHKTSLPLISLLRIIPSRILFFIQKFLKFNLIPYIRDAWRIRAIDFKHDRFKKSWFTMSQFEKLAWKWDKLNQAIYEAIEDDKNVIIVKFEDIFNVNKDFVGFFKIIEHFGLNIDRSEIELKIRESFSKKINKTSDYKIEPWTNWNLKQTKRFKLIAGDSMHLFGYM